MERYYEVPLPRRDWSRPIFSGLLLIIFSSMLLSRMIFQVASLHYLFNPNGALLSSLKWNSTAHGLQEFHRTTCNGLFSCTEKICDLWGDPNVSMVGWKGAGACPGIGTFPILFESLFEINYRNIAIILAIASSISSLILLPIYHFIPLDKKKIVCSIYLFTRSGLPIAFILNQIEQSAEMRSFIDHPPDYLIFWNWWEIVLSVLAYLLEFTIYSSLLFQRINQ